MKGIAPPAGSLLARVRAAIYLRDPRSAPLLDPPPVVNLPGNLPAPVAQQAWNQILGTIGMTTGPVLDFTLVAVAVESEYSGARWVTRGMIIGSSSLTA